MGLFNMFKKDNRKNELLEWQNTIMADKTDRLLMTEQQLRQATQQQAENDHRIMTDCAKLVETTVKPDVFFMRLNLLVEKARHLCSLEKYLSYSGASPTDALKEIEDNYQEAVRQFLVRYFSDTFDKAEAMKTEKGRLGKYTKFYESLQEYYQYMNEANVDYVETKYKAYVLRNKK